MSSRRLLRSLAAAAVLTLVPAAAVAATQQGSVVSSNASDVTPQLVPSSTVGRPRVDAIAQGNGMTVAAGLFDQVIQGGQNVFGLNNIVVFDSQTGKVNTSFKPSINGPVRALAVDASTNSVYVGGEFSTVDGAVRAGLVKLDLSTGAVDTGFKPYFSTGNVNDLRLGPLAGDKRLIVAGGMSKKIASVDPATGRNDGYITSTVTDAIPGAWGGVSVYNVAVDPSGTHLAATGNFRTVDGQARSRFFMLDLGSGGATLSDWYYPAFAKPCSSTAARRIAYLQGVDWSPDGKFLNVAATGQISLKGDVWHAWDTAANNRDSTVCDAVGRFALADDTKPAWINYTGGDSVWVAADTGAAVYIQGHFKWVDNPDGYASLGTGDLKTGEPAARRAGVAAINPDTGKAITSWYPATPTKTGGKAILATGDGVWFGNDSTKFGNELHYGLAFAPLR